MSSAKVIPKTLDNEYVFKILDNGSIVLNNSLSYNNKSASYQLELKACVSRGDSKPGVQTPGPGS